MKKKANVLKKRKWSKRKKAEGGKMRAIKKEVKRAEDLTAEETDRMRRSLTRNAKEVKHQMSLKEIKKLKKKGLEPKPKGIVIEGENNLKLGQGMGYKYR